MRSGLRARAEVVAFRDLLATVRDVTHALVLLALLALPCVAQGPDTIVTVHGFLERSDSGAWQLVLPAPLAVGGRRFNVLIAGGKAKEFSRLQERFVEARGRVTLAPRSATLAVARLQEVEPPGTGRSTIHPSFNQSAVITLSAIPNEFAWRLADGQASGVEPLLMYTVFNHGQTELDFLFRTNELLCVDVRDKTLQEAWHESVPAPTSNQEHIVIRLGGLYRHAIPIVPDAAPRPGRYVARVTLCGIPEYAVETEFAVRAP
jgi:hypothetical protein